MPESGHDRPGDQQESVFWGYFGVGCLTFFAGGAGGAMTSVLIAKIVGAIRGCAPDAETGAPCSWFTFAVVGGVLGGILLPSALILRLRRGRMAISERG